ncbi:MAG TPA: hypothetical protein VNJ08_07010 [Bacteriovoracaceae bacterium]|nr:hypothetical protein [Bacteriovoracaceae bacterium]
MNLCFLSKPISLRRRKRCPRSEGWNRRAKDLKDAGDKVKFKAFDAEVEELKLELHGKNDAFLARTSKLLGDEGVPNFLEKHNGNLVMTLSLDSKPTTNKAFSFYQRAQKTFGVDKVTISFGENAANKRSGFFRRSDGRVEIGYNEVLNLLDGQIGVTPRHEFRHAAFAHKEKSGVSSAFQMKFRSSKSGNLLNEHLRYDTYMSAEEIYNWSTDFQTLSKKLRDATPDIEAQTATEVPEKMIARLEETIKLKKYSRIEFLEGQFIGFEDELGRRLDLGYFGTEQKKMFEEAQSLNKRLGSEAKEFTDLHMKDRGLKYPESVENKLARKEFNMKYLNTPEGKKLSSKLYAAKEKIAIDAIERLITMKRIAEAQHKAVKVLRVALNNLENAPEANRKAHISVLRAQINKIGNNVKEGFKDSLFNKK